MTTEFSAKGLHARRHKTVRVVMALILREMTTSYGRSPGGYLWAILEPVLALGLMSFVFSMAFRSPGLGDNFPLFYATGYLPFMLYSDLAAKVGQAIRFSRPLLTYPSVKFSDAILARFLLNAMTHLVVALVVFSGIIMIFDAKNILYLPAILNAFLMAMTLGLGVGTLNCFLTMRFPIWERIWVIANRPLFIISCILFLFDSVPEPFRSVLWYNPLVHVTGEMRRGFYATYDASYVEPTFAYGISIGSLLLGLILLGRYNRKLLNEM